VVKIAIAFAALMVAAAITGCGKQAEPPAKTADQITTEKAAAEKRVRENAVWGEPVKSLDKAQDVQKSLDTQAAETAKKIDELAK
jgi:FlaG/FlaF family flagellin (archaellin)